MQIGQIRSTGMLLSIAALAACVAPQNGGDPRALERADRECYREAMARFGSPEIQRDAASGDRCDVQSWLCRKSEAWMLREGNPLSTATPQERRMHQHVKRCLAARGYPGR